MLGLVRGTRGLEREKFTKDVSDITSARSQRTVFRQYDMLDTHSNMHHMNMLDILESIIHHLIKHTVWQFTSEHPKTQAVPREDGYNVEIFSRGLPISYRVA